MLHLVEEASKSPKMRGLPKVHKAGRPMRPITSGVGSTSYRLAKILAKPLTHALGSLSNATSKTLEVIERLKGNDFPNKRLASLD